LSITWRLRALLDGLSASNQLKLIAPSSRLGGMFMWLLEFFELKSSSASQFIDHVVSRKLVTAYASGAGML
jgi:hypothetical protein